MGGGTADRTPCGEGRAEGGRKAVLRRRVAGGWSLGKTVKAPSALKTCWKGLKESKLCLQGKVQILPLALEAF